MTFIYSTCEDTCPTQVQSIRGALDRLGRDVPVIAVSVDPDNDTPARARAFLLEQSMTGRMDFLLGSREIASTTDLTVYSPESALGQAILGARPGQTVTYTAPSGADIKVTVVEFGPFEG